MNNSNNIYRWATSFKKRYPSTVAWRIKNHCQIAQKHLNDDETVLYVFTGQRNDNWYDIISTSVFVITDKRLIIAQDRLLFGYFLYSITPDMFNDLTVISGLIWGKIKIDTIKELVTISNLSKEALDEIETSVTKYMMEEKKEYPLRNKENE